VYLYFERMQEWLKRGKGEAPESEPAAA